MPGNTNPKYKERIRIRVTDVKKRYESRRDLDVLSGSVFRMSYVKFYEAVKSDENETHQDLVAATDVPNNIEKIREKLAEFGFEEVVGGNTEITDAAAQPSRHKGGGQQGNRHQPSHTHGGSNNRSQNKGNRSTARGFDGSGSSLTLKNKPYGFVPLPESFQVDAPVWHDGEGSRDRISGEIRFELTTLSPTLVGWEQQQPADKTGAWPIPSQSCDEEYVKIDTDGNETWSKKFNENKSVLYPLQAPWGKRPVIIPGDSLKGLLRHELGALLGVPMQLVAERSYSYRPNLSFPDLRDNSLTRVLEPRLARVVKKKYIEIEVGKDKKESYPIPEVVDIFERATKQQQTYVPPYKPGKFERYKGGLFGGQPPPKAFSAAGKRLPTIHTGVDVSGIYIDHENKTIEPQVLEQYKATLQHLFDLNCGHFSSRHPTVGNDRNVQKDADDAIHKAAQQAFAEKDIIWVEWDVKNERVVSFGWHYYYRWAYVDTVRTKGGVALRPGLGLTDEEKGKNGVRKGLSLVRRLFGFTDIDKIEKDGATVNVSNTGETADEKSKNYDQLMGRVSINAACEVACDNETDQDRFEDPTFLKELGGPKPSAVEHYLEQPYANAGRGATRPSDQAQLVTYGDAKRYDTPGELAGRKFYLDRGNITLTTWADDSDDNRKNDRSTLALRASKQGRRFRFTLMFRDLDRWEAAAIMVALCPNQFAKVLGRTHADGYCSKLGYARPLGWGSVRIEAKELLLLQLNSKNMLELQAQPDLSKWVKEHHRQTQTQTKWLEIHRRNHPDAGDYPREGGEIFTYHQKLRSEHSKLRRYHK